MKVGGADFETLFENANDIIVYVDKLGKVLAVNKKITKVFGHTPEELVGRNFAKAGILKPRDIPQIIKLFKDTVKTGKVMDKSRKGVSTMELELQNKSGETVFVEVNTLVIKDAGKTTGFLSVIRDIGERKKAEEWLRESELKHRNLVHNIPGMVYKGFPDWSAEFVAGSKEICGYTGEELNSKKQNWLGIIHSDDREEVFRVGSELAHEPKNLVQKYRIKTKDGEIRWVEDHKISLFSEGGEFKGIEGIVFDITGRKKVEEEIKNSHRRLLTVLDGINSLVYVTDMQSYELLFVNKYGRDVWGDIVGKTCWQALQNDQSGPCDFCTNKYLLDKKGKPKGAYEWEFQNTITKQWYFIIDRVIEWVDGRIVRLEIATDVTTRKKAENALLESEDRFRKLVENSADCICRIGLDSKITYINPAGVILNHHKDASEVIGSLATDRVKEKYLESMNDAIEKAKKGVSTGLEYESVTAGGDSIWWESIISPINHEEGDVKGLIRVSRDITQRKIIEQKLEKYSLELEDSNRLKDLFIDIIRHDLLNPAGVLRTGIELAITDETDPEKRSILNVVYNSSAELITRIESAALFAKIQSKDKVQFSTGDLGEYLERAVSEKSAFAAEKKIRIKMRKKGRYSAKLNPLMITAIGNLIDNSIKYSPENTEVTASITRHSTKLRLSVTDHGCGIPDAGKEAVFNRFARLEKGAVKGLGLGLAITKGIVEAHYGRVWVEDNPGGGSIFNIELPKAA